MFRNYLAAAWRSARRDRFYAILNTVRSGFGLCNGRSDLAFCAR